MKEIVKVNKYEINTILENGIKIKVKISRTRFHKLLWDMHLLDNINDIENIEIIKIKNV